MSVQVLSAALLGVDAVPVEVEVDLLRRLPAVTLVGLPASAVKESAERVRSAVHAVGEEFPRKRVVVNLAPADVRKEGTALDLPIALGILAADGAFEPSRLHTLVAIGELSLAGGLRPVRGALSTALMARRLGRTLIVPAENGAEAALVPGLDVRVARGLGEVVAWLRGEGELERAVAAVPPPLFAGGPDLSEVRGQQLARRALEIAAAGAHHLLMTGPPGCGKSMLAQRLPSILPPMSFEERLAVTGVHGAAGLLRDGALLARRPFRAPHHSLTVAGLIGDRTLRPGEVSLAHHGVLFLDEAPEFQRSVLEVLRAPLEDGQVHVARALGSVVLPAAVTLVLAANPCPCGYLGSSRQCRCTEADVSRYRRRLSGPILDRVDLHVQLEPVPAYELLSADPGEPSADVRARVLTARGFQRARGQVVPNGRLSTEELEATLPHGSPARAAFGRAVQQHALSARGATRLMRVARTIADLEGSEQIDLPHVSEALGFRCPEEAA